MSILCLARFILITYLSLFVKPINESYFKDVLFQLPRFSLRTTKVNFPNVISLLSLQDVPFQAVSIPDPLPPVDGKSVQPQPESNDPLTILCGRFSPDGSVLALCDDHKQITIWNTQNWTLKRQLNLARRANQVIFHCNDIIFIAGKSKFLNSFF